MLRVIVLGAGAGGGIPQWNSNAEACQRARQIKGDVRAKSQSSIAISADDTHWVIVNASPDLRQQLAATPALHPQHGFRSSPISDVILTNGDIDHIAGLLTLREGTPFTLRATKRVLETLGTNSVFDVLKDGIVAREQLRLSQPLHLNGLTIEPFPVPGKVALYLEDADSGDNFGTVEEDTIALKICKAGSDKSVFYMPACAAITEDVAARLEGADTLMFDGTLWDNDELVRQGGMPKTGARMGHISMSGPGGSISTMAPLAIRRRIFIHINNTNPVLLPESEERLMALAAGWEIAEDGMEVTL